VACSLGRLGGTTVDVFLLTVAAKLIIEVIFILLSAVLRGAPSILILEVVGLC
jgi:hypothetical protein